MPEVAFYTGGGGGVCVLKLKAINSVLIFMMHFSLNLG